MSCRLPEAGSIELVRAVLPDHTGTGATPAWRAKRSFAFETGSPRRFLRGVWPRSTLHSLACANNTGAASRTRSPMRLASVLIWSRPRRVMSASSSRASSATNSVEGGQPVSKDGAGNAWPDPTSVVWGRAPGRVVHLPEQPLIAAVRLETRSPGDRPKLHLPGYLVQRGDRQIRVAQEPQRDRLRVDRIRLARVRPARVAGPLISAAPAPPSAPNPSGPVQRRVRCRQSSIAHTSPPPNRFPGPPHRLGMSAGGRDGFLARLAGPTSSTATNVWVRLCTSAPTTTMVVASFTVR